jgi:hypothetical protein
MQQLRFFCVFLLALGLPSCSNDNGKIDVSDSKVVIKIDRFEMDFFRLKTGDIRAQTTALLKKYPEFFELYNSRIINIGKSDDPSYEVNLKSFLNNKDINEVYNDIAKKFPGMGKYEIGLTDAFKRYHYFFPEKKIPQVLTFFGGFNYSVVAAERSLGIGLEYYLGEDYKPYTFLQKPKYMIQRFKPEYIVSDAVKGWITTEFVQDESKGELIHKMIHQGKLMYLTDVLLADTPDTIKLGYTARQLKWIELSELSVWSYMIDKKLIYTTEYEHISKFFNEGPFTSGLPQESPPRLGVWLGWQIVKKYMKENPTVTLPQLMAEKDSQKILNKSKYRPSK